MALSLPLMATTLLSMTFYGPVTKPPRTVRPTPSLVQMKMDGGDLEHGLSSDRNADIQRLKKLFYSPSAEGSEDAASGEAAAAESWLLRDLPMARWSVALLPHQQVLLNVFQPEYVHMFEALLATPQPWYYMHALLPGGVEHLGHPDYALPGLGGADGDGEAPGDKAHLQGVLMQEQQPNPNPNPNPTSNPNPAPNPNPAQPDPDPERNRKQVVSVSRTRDARLRLVVQGVGRAVVLRGTQVLG